MVPLIRPHRLLLERPPFTFGERRYRQFVPVVAELALQFQQAAFELRSPGVECLLLFGIFRSSSCRHRLCLRRVRRRKARRARYRWQVLNPALEVFGKNERAAATLHGTQADRRRGLCRGRSILGDRFGEDGARRLSPSRRLRQSYREAVCHPCRRTPGGVFLKPARQALPMAKGGGTEPARLGQFVAIDRRRCRSR
jgi:hypothetical protein